MIWPKASSAIALRREYSLFAFGDEIRRLGMAEAEPVPCVGLIRLGKARLLGLGLRGAVDVTADDPRLQDGLGGFERRDARLE